MSNRKYRLIVAGQVSMITLLFLFVLNAEQLLQALRERSSIETSYTHDDAGPMAGL